MPMCEQDGAVHLRGSGDEGREKPAEALRHVRKHFESNGARPGG